MTNSKKKSKNLIIITCDEMRADALPFLGNLDCRADNIAAFAEKNLVFSKHFAVHGKCVPSRISMMTGRYAHTDGFRTIFQHLPENQPDLLKTLRENNYETAVFGHNHVWENFYGNNLKSSGCVDYHSFTENYFDMLNELTWEVPEAGGKKVVQMEEGYDYKGCIVEALSGHNDVNRAEQAVHYLREVRDNSRPFFMQINFSAPHPPYQVEEPYFSLYNRESIAPFPCNLPGNAPLPLKKMREIRTGIDADEDNFKEIRAVYYGMITKVDALVGKVLSAVAEQGLLENSVVIFTSDHGDFAGQYGLPEKWDTAMQDCILRVPLIIHAPELSFPLQVDSLTQHIDLPPTICELLEIDCNWGVHGESLLPVIGGNRKKNAIFADGGHEEEMWLRFNRSKGNKRDGKQDTYRLCPETMARTKMVRTEEWKLVVRLSGGNELYSLRDDPEEMVNLFGRSEYNDIVLALQNKLLQWCLQTDTDRPYQDKVGA